MCHGRISTPIAVAARADFHAERSTLALVVEQDQAQQAAQHDEGFVLVRVEVAVRRNVGILLHGVEQAVRRDGRRAGGNCGSCAGAGWRRLRRRRASSRASSISVIMVDDLDVLGLEPVGQPRQQGIVEPDAPAFGQRQFGRGAAVAVGQPHRAGPVAEGRQQGLQALGVGAAVHGQAQAARIAAARLGQGIELVGGDAQAAAEGVVAAPCPRPAAVRLP
jgi:hypothetical protein